jgi:hypothetical protein
MIPYSQLIPAMVAFALGSAIGLILGGMMVALAKQGHPSWPCKHRDATLRPETIDPVWRTYDCSDCGAVKVHYRDCWARWADGRESILAWAWWRWVSLLGAVAMFGLVFGP